MSEKCLAVVEINQDFCSRCYVCQSICPYKAINRDETGKVEVNSKDCQVCGICYSACPVSAIKMNYYTYDNLTQYLKEAQAKTKGAETLVLMCRGNSPSTGEVQDILKEQGVNVKNYIPLRLPCAGRVPTDFVFEALNLGIKNIVSIQCEDPFCRYKEGTKINTRRLVLARNVLKQLGFDENAVKIVKYLTQSSLRRSRMCWLRQMHLHLPIRRFRIRILCHTQSLMKKNVSAAAHANWFVHTTLYK